MPKELMAVFSDVKDAVTPASSRKDQKSWIWSDKEHSLFTYWLIQGLKGNADSDSDGKITLSELGRYLERTVDWTAQAVFKTSQKPILLNADQNDTFCFTPKAIPVKELLEEIAEQRV